jgi:hypothetical protein
MVRRIMVMWLHVPTVNHPSCGADRRAGAGGPQKESSPPDDRQLEDLKPMSVASNPPIYDQLIREHGDVVTEAREAARHTSVQAEHALDWSGLHRRFPAERKQTPPD